MYYTSQYNKEFGPLTLQVELLRSWGYKEVSCIKKLLMCGDEGMGAMAEVDTIVQTTVRMLEPRDLYSAYSIP